MRPEYSRTCKSLEIVRLDDLKVQNLGAGESGPWTADV
jgi:hypothetical protein